MALAKIFVNEYFHERIWETAEEKFNKWVASNERHIDIKDVKIQSGTNESDNDRIIVLYEKI